MSNRPVRSFLAIAAVLGSVLPGLVTAGASAAPAEPVVPTGGCWRYVPAIGSEIDDATGIIDMSTALEPWAADPRLTLGTAGDTVVGGVRTFSLDVAGGPALEPRFIDVKGSATFFFDVLDPASVRTELDPIVVDFDVLANTNAIPAMQVAGTMPLGLAGTSALVLRAVYFDLPVLPGAPGLPVVPGVAERLACNGQTAGDATINPATTPVDTSVLTAVTSVSATSLLVARVDGQKVLTAARPGDGVEVTMAGFPSEVAVPLGFCGPAGEADRPCGPSTPITTQPDGSAATTLVVPQDAVPGPGTIRARSPIGSADVTFDQPMRVLGEPALELGKTSAKNRVRVIGTEWDPLQPVRLRAVDEDGERVGKSVSVTAGAGGRIDARLTAGADVVSVVAEQQHRAEMLEASVDVPAGESDGTGGGTGGGTSGNGSGSTDPSAGTNTSGAPAAAAPVLPLDIPAPVDLPVTTVPDPQVAGTVAGGEPLAVTKVTLTGSARVSDLFGRGPKRVLKLQVENVGDADVIAPGLSIAVGKGKDSDPIYASDGFGRLAPGATRELTIPISLPAGAIGTYTVTGQLGTGDAGSFTVAWETYPWGLFGLNGLGILLIAFAIRRRIATPGPSRIAALVGTPRTAAAPGLDAGEAVIDLAVLERWWALQAGDAIRETVGSDTMDDAVVDVDAVERWLERCSARSAGSR